MKLLIHDLENEEFQKLFLNLSKEVKIIAGGNTIHPCIGCFGCWIKTPAACVIRDKYGDMGEYLGKSDEVIIISQCCYGGYSPFVKNVLDRSISYIHPYFQIKRGEMHHKSRYTNKLVQQIWFYGKDITEKEKETATQLVKANCINLDSTLGKITFLNHPVEMGGQIV